jgi:hypothetical protein
MVAVGTAHDALLTWFRASPLGPARRSASSALDGRGSFPEPGWGEDRPKGSGAPRLFCGGPRRRNATTLRPVCLCVITVRRA